jgi:hypothetical protein
MVARLNGVVGGILGPESFTLSQSYYLGHVTGKEFRHAVIEGDYIDGCDELDKGAIGKNSHETKFSGNGQGTWSGEYVKLGTHIRDFMSGASMHPSAASIIGKMFHDGIDKDAILEFGGMMFENAGQPRYSGRGREWSDLVEYVARKEEGKRAPPKDDLPPGEPLPGYTSGELETKMFDPLKMIVPKYFPEGVTLLAGKPKIGKSWLCIDTAYGVSRADVVLGEVCQRRDVVYFALEDNPRRMKARSEILLGGEVGWPKNLIFAHELPTLDRGGIERLMKYTDRNPDLGLIIIDTFAKFRGGKRKEEDSYTSDYRAMTALGDFYRETGVSIMAVHHVRKQTADDPQDTISGTLGLPAGADTPIVLYRNGEEIRMHGRGRDLDEYHKVMDFDGERGLWTIAGDYEGSADTAGTTRTLILSLLATAKYSMTPDQIAKATGLKAANVRRTLRRMLADREVYQPVRGTYSAGGK